MKVEYSQDMKTALFDGYKFRRDAKTGYYLASKPTFQGKRERLHVYVWRYFNGPVADGYHVHHKDENKEHNDIENLTCIRGKAHMKYHLLKYTVNHREEMVENLANNAIPKAAEWHRSEEGRKWHRKHWTESIGVIKPKEHTCAFCGKKYISKKKESNRFCSINCRAAARRKSGVDDETRKCEFCEKEFMVNKYAVTKCCSRSCARRLRSIKQREDIGQTTCI